jgi:phytoene dehydrogenase-like protein
MSPPTPSTSPALIVGGGIAGLAAAVRLAERGVPVTLLETRKKLGGRATSFTDVRTGEVLDNCQHVVLGCCTNYLDLLARLGVADRVVFMADGRLAGTQGLRGEKFPVLRTVGTGSWLGREFQVQGFGKEMRSAALSFAFDYLGADWATTSAFIDNASSAGVSRALGYVEDGHDRLAPRGEARDLQRYLMTRDNWYSRERPPIDEYNPEDHRRVARGAEKREGQTAPEGRLSLISDADEKNEEQEAALC